MYDRRMEIQKSSSRPRSHASFWLLIIGIIGIGVYSLISLRQTMAVYDQADSNINSVAPARKFTVPGNDKPVFMMPAYLKQGQVWGLISRTHPLPKGFVPPELINTSVAHGDSGTNMQVQKHIEPQLRALFAAAEDDNIELMLSSAYRSIDDQQKLYDQFVAEQGEAMAKQYVAVPGTSEHHTGLAVDMSSASPQCEADSDSCSLSQAAAVWLRQNAAKFGFIQRYPEGKQPITGVAFEPWHYRYVGVPLAREVANSNLTLDEVIEQMAPGIKAQAKR